MKVILLGYMGSGKSTVGKELASILSYNFIDLDDYIVKNEKKSIPEIFADKGEVYFRKREYHYLQEVLAKKNDLVLALGGGTPCYGHNMDIIKKSVHSSIFYFKGSIEFLTERLFKEKENRPLIRHMESTEQLQEFIGKHLFERGFYYNQTNNIIDIDNKPVKDIVEELIFNLLK